MDYTVMAQEGVSVKEVHARQPFIKAEPARIYRAIFLKRTDMPLSKVPRCIAFLFQGLRYGAFLRAHWETVVQHAGAVGMPAGQNACPRWGADGGGRVESVEPQRGLGHGVKIGGFDVRMAIIAHIAPALVIGHAKNDIREFVGFLTDR